MTRGLLQTEELHHNNISMKLLIYILLLASLSLKGQDCFVDESLEDKLRFSDVYVPETLNIPVHFINHYTNIDGKEVFSINEGDVDNMIDRMNEAYETINLYFASMETTYDSTFWEFEYVEHKDAMTQWEREGYIMNVHIVGNVRVAGRLYAGVALYPYGGRMWCVIGRNYKYTSTVPHEASHTLGLDHTFQNSHLDFLAETVDGFECDVRGDLVCDTKCDHPDMAYTNCTTPIRTILDFNGEVIEGEPTNIMSYNSKHCRTEITEGQEYRARMIIASIFGDGIPTGFQNKSLYSKQNLLPLYQVGNVIGNKRIKK